MTSRPRSPEAIALSLALLAMATACEIGKQLDEGGQATDGTDGGDLEAGATESGAAIAVDDAPAAMATAFCAAFYACECPPSTLEPWDTQAACEAEMTHAFEAGFADSIAKEQTYDPGCVETFIEFYDTAGCGPSGPDSERAWREVMRCPPFYGTLEAGDACTELAVLLPSGSDCGYGLLCNGTSCEPSKADGEPCRAIPLENECALESFCDASTEPARCSPLPELGQPCDEDVLCGPDAFCAGDTCAPLPATGESCAEIPACAWGRCDPDTSTCVAYPAACTPNFP